MFGTYSYRLKQIDRNGNFEYSKEVEAAVTMTPNTILLGQNYPNPFNLRRTSNLRTDIRLHNAESL